MAPDNVRERLQHAYQSFLENVEEFYDKEKEDIGEAVAHARERLHEIEDLTAEEVEEVTHHFIENMADIGEQMTELREGVRDAIKLDTMYITTGILERLIKVADKTTVDLRQLNEEMARRIIENEGEAGDDDSPAEK
jgi:acyl-CoA reductase-like NAD-dependent aldehyde dehydrogenase